MTPATSTIASSPSLPTLAAIQRRRRELLAYQSEDSVTDELIPIVSRSGSDGIYVDTTAPASFASRICVP